MVDILAFHSSKSTGVSNNTNNGFTAVQSPLRQNKCDQVPFAVGHKCHAAIRLLQTKRVCWEVTNFSVCSVRTISVYFKLKVHHITFTASCLTALCVHRSATTMKPIHNTDHLSTALLGKPGRRLIQTSHPNTPWPPSRTMGATTLKKLLWEQPKELNKQFKD